MDLSSDPFQDQWIPLIPNRYESVSRGLTVV